PLVDEATWEAVQQKLDGREKRAKAPTSPEQYLAKMVYCGNCGGRMVAGPLRKATSKPRKDGHTGNRHEYIRRSYFRAAREKWPWEGTVRREPCKCKRQGQCTCERRESRCLRNGVFQDVLDEYVERYLEETGEKLDLLMGGIDTDHLTERLKGERS